MANSLTNQQWDEWKAVAIIDGWFNGWSQTSELVASIHNAANRIVVSNSSKPDQTNSHQTYLSGVEVAKRMTEFSRKRRGTDPREAEKIAAARQEARYRRGS